MRRQPHTSTTPGKRVRLILRDGGTMEGKFVERTPSKFIVLDIDGERVKTHRVKIDKFIVVKTAMETRT
jgi:hypothetical protein